MNDNYLYPAIVTTFSYFIPGTLPAIDLHFTAEQICMGFLIMGLRVVDVSVGTLRMISVVNSRIKLSFLLGFVEVSVWLLVISSTLKMVQDNLILGVFYVLGFSMGNVIGILIEERLQLGNLTLRVFSPTELGMADKIRKLGYGATVFEGKGKDGAVELIFSFIPRKALKEIMPLIGDNPKIFYTFDYGGYSNKRSMKHDSDKK